MAQFICVIMKLQLQLCMAAQLVERRSLCSANAAQQSHNVGFVIFDGMFEGSPATTAGKRVSGNCEKNTTQNQ